MDERRAALTRELTEMMRQIGSGVRLPADDEWVNVDLTMPQLRTLVLLRDGPRRMSDLAASLGTSLPSVTSMVERLEGKDLVRRMPDLDDRRGVIGVLTERGRDELERFSRVRRSRVQALVDLLTLDELETVLQAIRIISNALDRRDTEAAGAPDDHLTSKGR